MIVIEFMDIPILITGRSLEEQLNKFKKKFPNHKKVPRPPYWSGFALKANVIEFWLDGNNRIHERLRYKKSVSGWIKEILYP